jgi:hypothetical protein
MRAASAADRGGNGPQRLRRCGRHSPGSTAADEWAERRLPCCAGAVDSRHRTTLTRAWGCCAPVQTERACPPWQVVDADDGIASSNHRHGGYVDCGGPHDSWLQRRRSGRKPPSPRRSCFPPGHLRPSSRISRLGPGRAPRPEGRRSAPSGAKRHVTPRTAMAVGSTPGPGPGGPVMPSGTAARPGGDGAAGPR